MPKGNTVLNLFKSHTPRLAVQQQLNKRFNTKIHATTGQFRVFGWCSNFSNNKLRIYITLSQF